MAMFSCIVPDDGGGNGDGGDTGAVADDGGTAVVPNSQDASANAGDGEDTITVPKSVLEQMASMANTVNAIETERGINSAVEDIKGRNSDFDIGKVKEHLLELKKTNPEEAARMNNPQGWELLWLRDIAEKSVSADAVNNGRNVSGDSGRDELASKINSGNGSIEDQAEYYAKYF